MNSAFVSLGDGRFGSTELTRGPWDPGHQHAGPPIALVARAIEHAAAGLGMRPAQESAPARFPFDRTKPGYADYIESRVAEGAFFQGPSAVWFRMRYPLLEGEAPSPHRSTQSLAVRVRE